MNKDMTNFPDDNATNWYERINKENKGKNLQELDWNYQDGPEMKPLYHESQNLPIISENPSWWIGETFAIGDELPDSASLSSNLMESLNGGINSPSFSNIQPSELSLIFKGVSIDFLHINFDSSKDKIGTEELMGEFLHFVSNNNFNTAQLQGSLNLEWKNGKNNFGFTPIEIESRKDWSTLENWKWFSIDFHSENGVISALKTLKKELTLFKLAGGKPKHLSIKWYIGKEYFSEISIGRAIQLLSNEIFEDSIFIDAYFDKNSQSENPNNNLISASSMAISAILGGANRLTVMPCDAHSNPSQFGRRMARNVQHLLQIEGYFDKVNDPLAGSYFIENYTKNLLNEI
jgi:methylmalonyl-CoA mutase